MKFSKIFLIAALSSASSALSSDFFNGATVERAELFDITDLNMPTLRINLSDEAYDRFQLTYQCLYDTHPSVDNENENCYKAPWVNYAEILNLLIQDGTINSELLTVEQLNLVNDPELTYDTFSSIISNYSTLTMQEIFSQNHSYVTIPSYEEKGASLDFFLNDEQIDSKDDVKLSIGGKYTQVFEKPQYNIQLKNGDLFGRSQLRLRSEVIDPSFLRSKIASDLTDILGLPSIQSSFTKFFINNDDMGLYLLRDAFKPEWIESNFGVVNTTSLYKCDAEYGNSLYFNCINDVTEEPVDPDFQEFSKQMEYAVDYDDYSKFFDVDLYIKWQAYKYLTGSWDHVTTQHNQYLFKNGNKWMNFLYDYDSDFGAFKNPNPAQSFTQHSIERDLPIYRKLRLDESNTQLIGYIEDMIVNGFNPVKLFPRIDELIDYLSPYVAEDRYPMNDPTARPGHFNRPEFKIENSFTVQDHYNNAGFHNYLLKKYVSETSFETEEIYGLKRWIIERFRFVCSNYNFDCSFASEYLEDGSFVVPDKVETEVVLEEHKSGCRQSGYPCCKSQEGGIVMTDAAGEWGVEGNVWCLYDRDVTPIEMPVSFAVSNASSSCWASEQGFPCCKKPTRILYTDENGKNWDVENHKWCAIP